VSVVLVLLGHLHDAAGFAPLLDGRFPKLLHNPTLGVRVFFVISGFLITTLLLREERKHGSVSIGGFYLRRALRILPPLVAYVAVVAAFELAVGHFRILPHLHALTFTTGGFFPANGSKVLGHTWSLAVEEQFYLAWPFVFAALGMSGRLRCAMALVVLAPFARAAAHGLGAPMLVKQSIVGQGDLLMVGCACALLLHLYPEHIRKVTAWSPALGRLAAVALIVALQHISGPGTGYFTVPFRHSCEALLLGYLLLSLVLVERGLSYRLLNLKLVAAIGVLSYSLYVWQQLWLYPGGGDGYEPYPFQRFPQNLVGACVCALLSYVLVERPFLRRKQRVSDQAHGAG
jgi:peptidoglycan/LPS O-acetylase OafA/YrhL